MAVSKPIWNGNARILPRPSREIVAVMRMSKPATLVPPRSFLLTCAASMTFRLKVRAEAERYAESILEWLRLQHAGDRGLRWVGELESAIASLAEFPKRCPLAPENRVFRFEVRHLLYGHKPHMYRILFTIDRTTVHGPARSPWPSSANQALTKLSGIREPNSSQTG